MKKIKEACPYNYITNYKYLQSAQDTYNKQKKIKPFVVWLSGHAGHGKNYLADYLAKKIGYLDEEIATVSIDDQRFFINYKTETPYVILDEYASYQYKFKEFLALLDKKESVSVKGSEVRWNPNIIVITSITGAIDGCPRSLKECATDDLNNTPWTNSLIQLRRRIHCEYRLVSAIKDLKNKIPARKSIERYLDQWSNIILSQYHRFLIINDYPIPVVCKLIPPADKLRTEDIEEETVMGMGAVDTIMKYLNSNPYF